jgi:hypothetical protein
MTTTTIQFTYNKNEDIYCFGFWVNENFITRACGNKDFVWTQFLQELKRLEDE